MTKAKKPSWPKELKVPFKLSRAPTPQVFGALAPTPHINDLISEELARRIKLMADFLQVPMPSTLNRDWLMFVLKLCAHWDIPAFHAPPKRVSRALWTDQKRCELFGDIQRLVRGGHLTEHGACIFVSENPHLFGERYIFAVGASPEERKSIASTIHRKFVAVKSQIIADAAFRWSHFKISAGGGLAGSTSPRLWA